MMIRSKKGGIEVSLEMLMAIVLTAVIVMIFVPFAANAFGKQSSTLETVAVEDVVRQVDSLVSVGEFTIQPSPHDLILFFSRGTGPIVLENVLSSDDFIFENIFDSSFNLKTNKNLVFPRPTECQDRSCVCTCTQNELWIPSSNVPYLTLQDIQPRSDFTPSISCAQLQCQATTNPSLVFANERGIDGDESPYYREVSALVAQMNENLSQSIYVPIELDIVSLLVREKYEIGYLNDGTFFGNNYVENDYNRFEQSEDYIKYLINDLRWSGGVVIGGSGFAQTKQDVRNRELIAPRQVIRLEKYNNVIGVCLFEQCLFEEGKAWAEAEAGRYRIQDTLEAAVVDLHNYLDNELNACLNDAKTSQERNNCIEHIVQLYMHPALSRYPWDVRVEFSFTVNDNDNVIIESTLYDQDTIVFNDSSTLVLKGLRFQTGDGRIIPSEDIVVYAIVDETDPLALRIRERGLDTADYIYTLTGLEEDGQTTLYFKVLRQEPATT